MLIALPPDILLNVLVPLLHEKDLSMLSGVCRRFHTLFFSLIDPQYRATNSLFDYEKLGVACYSGRIGLVEWFFKKRRVTICSDSFRQACRGGHIDLVEWMINNLDLQDEIVSWGFIGACESGNLEIAKFLGRQFNVIDTDWAFRAACSNGHTAVVKWMLKSYHISPSVREWGADWADRCGHHSLGHLLKSINI